MTRPLFRPVGDQAGTGRAAAGLGMRRVDWVRILVAGGTVRCDAQGVGHRLPCRRPLSLGAALALRAVGVPTIIRRESAGDPPPIGGEGDR